MQLLRRKYIWYRPNGRSVSRIDRALVSTEWGENWGSLALRVFPRDVSDHCPLVLKVDGCDWGPKPFIFNNHWLDDRNFKKMVEVEWRNQEVNGLMGLVLHSNGSPTEEIIIQRGLKQGNPLAPFVFLLVVEGFSGLMSNAVNRELRCK